MAVAEMGENVSRPPSFIRFDLVTCPSCRNGSVVSVLNRQEGNRRVDEALHAAVVSRDFAVQAEA